MKCILIVFEGSRPPPPKSDGLSSGRQVIPYGQSAYIVGVEDMTIDDVMKSFNLCGQKQSAAMAVEMGTYRGCSDSGEAADRINKLLSG